MRNKKGEIADKKTVRCGVCLGHFFQQGCLDVDNFAVRICGWVCRCGLLCIDGRSDGENFKRYVVAFKGHHQGEIFESVEAVVQGDFQCFGTCRWGVGAGVVVGRRGKSAKVIHVIVLMPCCYYLRCGNVELEFYSLAILANLERCTLHLP